MELPIRAPRRTDSEHNQYAKSLCSRMRRCCSDRRGSASVASLETRAYAVKRHLFRVGHAAGSVRYATSVEQLAAG